MRHYVICMYVSILVLTHVPYRWSINRVPVWRQMRTGGEKKPKKSKKNANICAGRKKNEGGEVGGP